MRLISALEFKDRLVQHALVSIIGGFFEAQFLPNTFACRVGLGTHAGVKYIQTELRKSPQPTYFLKTDFRKFFPSIDHSILIDLIERKIKCKLTLDIIYQLLKKGDVGIPIGSLTSQLFANIYGAQLDGFIHHTLKHRRWARYMDDVIILGSDPQTLRNDFNLIEEFSKDKLKMTISKWQCASVNRGINFLGYRIWPTHKLIRKDSVLRAKRKIKRFVKNADDIGLNKFISAWYGHANWADTSNLITYLDANYVTCTNNQY
jgi:RNA-directed DNA polymerase